MLIIKILEITHDYQNTKFITTVGKINHIFTNQQTQNPQGLLNKSFTVNNEEFVNQQKILEQIKTLKMNNSNFNELINMGFYNNPSQQVNPNNLHNLLINSMYSNIFQNYSIPKTN